LGLTSRRGGIAQDDARNRRTSSRSRPVGTTELPGSKGFSIQKALRHGARNLHELDVSADEFALVDLGAPSLGPAPDPRNADARIDRPNAVGEPRPRTIVEERVLRHDTAIEP